MEISRRELLKVFSLVPFLPALSFDRSRPKVLEGVLEGEWQDSLYRFRGFVGSVNSERWRGYKRNEVIINRVDWFLMGKNKTKVTVYLALTNFIYDKNCNYSPFRAQEVDFNKKITKELETREDNG